MIPRLRFWNEDIFDMLASGIIEDIAWGSSVWIENEPNNMVHFEGKQN